MPWARCRRPACARSRHLVRSGPQESTPFRYGRPRHRPHPPRPPPPRDQLQHRHVPRLSRNHPPTRPRDPAGPHLPHRAARAAPPRPASPRLASQILRSCCAVRAVGPQDLGCSRRRGRAAPRRRARIADLVGLLCCPRGRSPRSGVLAPTRPGRTPLSRPHRRSCGVAGLCARWVYKIWRGRRRRGRCPTLAWCPHRRSCGVAVLCARWVCKIWRGCIADVGGGRHVRFFWLLGGAGGGSVALGRDRARDAGRQPGIGER
jgi:hypothetical protein